MSEKLAYNPSLNVPLLLNDEEKAIVSHPSAENTVSFFGTCLNGLNTLSGVGILSVPYALSSGGWLSLTLLFVIVAAAFYTSLLIKRCMDKNSNIRTYSDMGELAFGKTGRLIVLIICFLLTTAGNAYIAIIGYIMFGDEVESQVTLNLPLDKISSKVIMYIILVNPISKFALTATPIMNALKHLLPRTYKIRVKKLGKQ
ncbi:unnamed protein product, partial [Sphenostylis stenocarpa]